MSEEKDFSSLPAPFVSKHSAIDEDGDFFFRVMNEMIYAYIQVAQAAHEQGDVKRYQKLNWTIHGMKIVLEQYQQVKSL